MSAYGPMFGAVEFGDALNKGLTLRMNQAPVKRQWPRLLVTHSKRLPQTQ